MQRDARMDLRRAPAVAAAVSLACSLALLPACERGERQATGTVAAAAPRPAPTSDSAVRQGPFVTTSGSPPPHPVPAPGTERMTLRADAIVVRPSIPVAQTVFLITNETAEEHRLTLQHASGRSDVTVPPNGDAVVQLNLEPGGYVITCQSKGHRERATFETYVAGSADERLSR
jgi:hypothetical protein